MRKKREVFREKESLKNHHKMVHQMVGKTLSRYLINGYHLKLLRYFNRFLRNKENFT